MFSQPDAFELVPGLKEDNQEGIGVSKKKAQLETGVKAALQSMVKDGTYLQILDKYGNGTEALGASTP